MKIVVDNKIPFINGILEPFSFVKYINGADIERNDIIDADAIIIRTRTKVNEELLYNTSVKFVGSTTIGTDHIDIEWCRKNGISCFSAPGCNSGSVTQYIASALAELQSKISFKPGDTTLGIIGVGNVGKKVATLARQLGYKVLLNDPPRSRIEGSSGFVTLKKLKESSDIISLHVPLTYSGIDKTYELIDSSFLKTTSLGLTIINTSRGEVINETHLLNSIKSGHTKAAIIDVWTGEPILNRDLLDKVFLATPHIAGYSADGKLNGTRRILNSIADFFNLSIKTDHLHIPEPDKKIISLNDDCNEVSEMVSKAILDTYQIIEDHKLLAASPEKFEQIRDSYRVRREFPAYSILGNNKEAIDILQEIGFK